PAAAAGYRVMLCISHEQAGPGLAGMAASLLGGGGNGRVDAVHLVPATGRGGTAMVGRGPGAADGEEVLAPAVARAAELGVEARTLSFISDDPATDICELAEARDADLVLLGWHKPVLSQTMLGGVVHDVLNRCPSTVGVLVDRGLKKIERVLVPYLGSAHDRTALALAQRLMTASGARVTVLHVVREEEEGEGPSPAGGARTLVDSVFSEDSGHVTMRIIKHRSPAEAALAESERGYDLVIVGIGRDWGLGDRVLGIGLQPEKLMTDSPSSLLVVRGTEASPRRRLARATARVS
ncbi:MAG TPA: universal stress protein, partial [Kofleriaceae bacterium]|nr:universal stress protein [Kofleriaceae bacterium]